MHIQLKEPTMSYFTSLVSSSHSPRSISVFELYTLIRGIKYKAIIQNLRIEKDKTLYNHIKSRNLPAVTVSGLFVDRNKDSLVTHSGLMQVDFDNLHQIEGYMTLLKRDPYTLLCFLSPGGKGIKLIVRILPSVETHKAQFEALEEYYQSNYGLAMDQSCKDISRCMLLSYDANAYLNQNAQVFEKLKTLKPNPVVAIRTIKNYASSKDDQQLVENITNAVEEAGIDITASYRDWINIGFSLISSLGEGGRGYFHRLSANHSDYNYQTADEKYSQLQNHNGQGITLGTLVYTANNHGVGVRAERRTPLVLKEPISPNELRIELRKLRLKLAKEEGAPAFIIFYDKTMEELIVKRPLTIKALEKVYGFGKVKTAKYGAEIVSLFNGLG